jgi:hypothetical protein
MSRKGIAMSTTIAPIEPEAAIGQAAEPLNQARAPLGLVPNMAKVTATSTALLKSYFNVLASVRNGWPAVRL